MKKFVFPALFLLLAAFSHAQSLKKYPISNSGCSLYMFCDPGKFDVDKSEDSSMVYTAECVKEEVTYGVICIKLLNPVTDLDAAEDLVTSYLDYLKLSFEIASAAGYGKGHRLNNNENTRGIIDYWTDKEKEDYKVKAWTDGNFIGVLYAKSKKEIPETKVNVYLEGFRFPGM
jgi:hypothetical protein